MQSYIRASPYERYAAAMSAPSLSTIQARIAVVNLAPVQGGRLVALADVELLLDGVSIILHGVQVRADGAGTEVTLPKYRAADGSWHSAITLPDELKGPMGDVVIAASIEAGVLKQR
jgi:stage V sporulation protein G